MTKIQDLDWAEAIQLYRQGDISLGDLSEYARGARLSQAAQIELQTTIGLGRALEREQNRKSLKDLTARYEAQASRQLATTVGLTEVVTRLARQYRAGSAALAAATATPSANVKALCDIRCSLQYAPPGGVEQSLELIRFLNDDWKLVVLPPSSDVIAIEVGGRPLTEEKGVFVLLLRQGSGDESGEPLPAREIADLVCREMLITFRDGPQLAVIFA
ncbi:MAG: hypothetical protein Q8M16_11600 [Pirellulaceae bacterium]|nr:hypothetical protein [Pirellulaceae bacterium]